MTLIESKVLGTAAASIEFTSIPQDGTDLLLKFSLRSSQAGFNFDDPSIRLNSDTGNNYSSRVLQTRDGTVASNSGPVSSIPIFGSPSAGATSNTFGSGEIYIPNYAGSTTKSVSVDAYTENNDANGVLGGIIAGRWNNTAAITVVTFFSQNAWNFVTGSTVSLYKITKGSSGGVVVS